MSAQIFSSIATDRGDTVGTIGSNNSIGAIRLVAAWLVVLGHSFPLGGFGEDPLIALTSNQIAMGRVPVDVFFCLSGYLIAKSFANRGGIISFAWARFLRIYPAYWVCIAITAFAISPLLNGNVSPTYFFKNIPLLFGAEGYIAGTVLEHGQQSPINGALWTLKWELLAYIFCAGVGMLGWLGKPRLILGIFIATWAVFIYKIYSHPGLATSPAITSGWRLFTFFLCGMFFYSARRQIVLSRNIFILALVSMLCALLAGNMWPLSSGGFFTRQHRSRYATQFFIWHINYPCSASMRATIFRMASTFTAPYY